MDLIDDLGTDLAVAFLVEEKHLERIERKDAVCIIGRVRHELSRVAESRDHGEQDGRAEAVTIQL